MNCFVGLILLLIVFVIQKTCVSSEQTFDTPEPVKKTHVDDIDIITTMALAVENGVDIVLLYNHFDLDTLKVVLNLANKTIRAQNQLCILLVRAVVVSDMDLVRYLVNELDVSPICVPKYTSIEEKIKNEEL